MTNEEIAALLARHTADEREVFELSLIRLDAGRATYGPLHAEDGRDDAAEALAEAIDLTHYLAKGLVRVRRMVSRLAAEEARRAEFWGRLDRDLAELRGAHPEAATDAVLEPVDQRTEAPPVPALPAEVRRAPNGAKLCSEPGCPSLARRRGLCQRHGRG